MEVEMLARAAEIFGDYLDDTAKSLELANKASMINPGQKSLRTAYEAAGIEYIPSRYRDKYYGVNESFEEDEAFGSVESSSLSVTISPNPANPATTLHYTLAKPGNVKLAVFNSNGQKVATLVDNYMSAGKHSAVFDGSDLASGVYFYRLESKDFAKSGKMLLIK